MSEPIIATKLYIPRSRSKTIVRSNLIERLNNGLQSRLTLISAPAGFGKTTLVSEWLSAEEHPAAWLSMDKADNDSVHFLKYLIAALDTVVPVIDKGLLNVLNSPQPPPMESVLILVLNEINTHSKRFTIVFDDYHVIDTRPVDDATTFLIDHLPAQVNLIITSREDPRIPLSRLRACSQLTELRAADLRFTTSEAADFFNHVMGLTLSSEDVDALATRTEGWIAGLHLAALSMQGNNDITGFIKSFTGSHHFVMDYLLEEVLLKQPEHIKRFLLYTSILDRLCGPLCDAVLLNPSISGQATLEHIEQVNLFIFPLDYERQWYRYHHLFADLLLQRLHQSDTLSTGNNDLSVAELHIRASKWYEANGLEMKAIHHAFEARDFERAANLIEIQCTELDENYHTENWFDWAKALPEEFIHRRPVLCVEFAWGLLVQGDLEKAESLLQVAEQWLNTSPNNSDASVGRSAGMVVVADDDYFRALPANIANLRAISSFFMGDLSATLKYTQQAFALVPKGGHFVCGTLYGTLAMVNCANGDLEAAYNSANDCIDSLKMAGRINFAASIKPLLSDIMFVQGRLRSAMSLYEPPLQHSPDSEESLPQIMAELYLGLSAINREQGDLKTATQHLQRSKAMARKSALPDWHYRWNLSMARLNQSMGDLNGALELFDETMSLYSHPFVPDIRPVDAMKTRVLVCQRRLTEALNWVRERGLSVKDDPSFMLEFEHITLVRILITDYKESRSERSIVEATELLERLVTAAEKGGRMGSVIELIVLQVLAYEAQTDVQSAVIYLKRALSLAEPEGYVRVFLDEGLPIVRLLSKAAGRGKSSAYATRLLTIFNTAEGLNEKLPVQSDTQQPLIEPLSKREIEVLQLIAQGLTNHEIGERLFLALDTVKGHNRNIFGKLQVKRRTEAVARANDLGLL